MKCQNVCQYLRETDCHLMGSLEESNSCFCFEPSRKHAFVVTECSLSQDGILSNIPTWSGQGRSHPQSDSQSKTKLLLVALVQTAIWPGFPSSSSLGVAHAPVSFHNSLSGLSWSRRHDANYKSMLQSSLQLVVKQSVAMVHDSRSSWTAWHVQDLD